MKNATIILSSCFPPSNNYIKARYISPVLTHCSEQDTQVLL